MPGSSVSIMRAAGEGGRWGVLLPGQINCLVGNDDVAHNQPATLARARRDALDTVVDLNSPTPADLVCVEWDWPQQYGLWEEQRKPFLYPDTGSTRRCPKT